jgi:hypothetical protein
MFYYINLTIFFLVISVIFIYCIKKSRIRFPKHYKKTFFHGFKEKMWMTVGLGLTFFTLYFLMTLGLSVWLESTHKAALFSMAHSSPLEFIYMGLFLFATLSLCIYIVRLIIKFIYLFPN